MAKELMIIDNKTFNLEDIKVNAGVIVFDKEEYSKALDALIEKYTGIVVTEEEVKNFKKEVSNLRAFKGDIDAFRKEKEKIYSSPLESFKSDIKDLTGKIDAVIENLNGQLSVFEEKRKAEKQKNIDKIKHELINDYDIAQEYEAGNFNFIEPANFLNSTKKFKEIKAELEEQIKNYVTSENNRIEKEKAIQEKKEFLESQVHQWNATFELEEPIKYTEVEYLIELPLTEIVEAVKEICGNRKINEVQFNNIKVAKEEEAKKEIVEPQEKKEVTKTVSIRFKDMKLSEAHKLMNFIKENKINFEVLKP